MAFVAGARLGPYEIVAPLGAGGMGEVYKARDTRLDRTVAVKILPAALAAVLVLAAVGVQAEEIKVMTSGALSAALRELAPSFERASGSTLIIVSGGSVGGAPDSIPDRLQRGERADVLIMAAGGIDDLMQAGRVVAGSRVDLARSSIGVAVRAGAPKPDISSVDALKRTLLQAKSIAYSSSVSGMYVSTELFQRLGIANQVLAKSRKVDSEPVAAVVARGDAEIGFQQISELRPVPGIEVVGPLPPEVQRVTVFSAAPVAGSANPSGGRALIAFLSSPAASAAIAKSGMDPVTPPPADHNQRFLAGGVFVVRGGQLQNGVAPGRPIRAVLLAGQSGR